MITKKDNMTQSNDYIYKCIQNHMSSINTKDNVIYHKTIVERPKT